MELINLVKEQLILNKQEKAIQEQLAKNAQKQEQQQATTKKLPEQVENLQHEKEQLNKQLEKNQAVKEAQQKRIQEEVQKLKKAFTEKGKAAVETMQEVGQNLAVIQTLMTGHPDMQVVNDYYANYAKQLETVGEQRMEEKQQNRDEALKKALLDKEKSPDKSPTHSLETTKQLLLDAKAAEDARQKVEKQKAQEQQTQRNRTL